MGERQWCLSCGTVTRDGTCDCTRTDRPELQNLVNYADEMKREVDALRTRVEMLTGALEEIQPWLSPEPRRIADSALSQEGQG